MNTSEQLIPVFKFGSQALEQFHLLNKFEQEYTFNYRDGHCLTIPTYANSTRKLWVKSGIQYIVDHGQFKTLETTVVGQVNTISKVIPS